VCGVYVATAIAGKFAPLLSRTAAAAAAAAAATEAAGDSVTTRQY